MINADDNCWEKKKQTNKKKQQQQQQKPGKLNNRGFKNFLEVLP